MFSLCKEPDWDDDTETIARSGELAPLSTSTMRSEYAAARCNGSQFVSVSFPGWLLARNGTSQWNVILLPVGLRLPM